jgi:hypothetical protein
MNKLESNSQKIIVVVSLGEDSGPQDQRLRCTNTWDFGPEPETLAKESGLLNLDFQPSGSHL